MGALLSGTDSDVWLTASPSIALGATPETCNDSGDHTVYFANTHTAWDKRAVVPLAIEGSPNGTTGWIAMNDYVFDYPIGRITFTVPRVVGTNDHVRIKANTGAYFNLSQVADAFTWNLAQKVNVVDTTPFQTTSGFKRKTLSTKTATGTVDTYRTDNTVFLELGNLVVVVLYVDKSMNIRFVCYGWITGIDPKGEASTIMSQAFSFESEGAVYWLTS